jgi:hypothetical protein
MRLGDRLLLYLVPTVGAAWLRLATLPRLTEQGHFGRPRECSTVTVDSDRTGSHNRLTRHG